MKRFLPSIGNGGMRLFNSDFANILTTEIYDAVAAGWSGVSDDRNMVLFGCGVSTSGGVTTVASGIICFDRDIHRFAGWSGTLPSVGPTANKGWIIEDNPSFFQRVFKNLTMQNVHKERKFKVVLSDPGATPSIEFGLTSIVNVNDFIHPVATVGAKGEVKPDGTTITVDSDGTIHANLTAASWQNIPYDDGSVTPGAGNGRYSCKPFVDDATLINIAFPALYNEPNYASYAYRSTDANWTSKAETNRLKYRVNKDGSTDVKGFMRRVVKTRAGVTELNFDPSSGSADEIAVTVTSAIKTPALPTGLDGGGNGNIGVVLDEHLMFLYPLAKFHELGVVDLVNSGFIPVFISLDASTVANLNNYNISNVNKIKTIFGLMHIGNSAIRIYSNEKFTGLTAATEYTMFISVNGKINN